MQEQGLQVSSYTHGVLSIRASASFQGSHTHHASLRLLLCSTTTPTSAHSGHDLPSAPLSMHADQLTICPQLQG